MDIYKINNITELLSGNTYPGRGIVIGKTADGKKAVAAYFIMGRSANSRNRVFTERGGAVYTEPFDASKVEDPSLIIYAAIRAYENNLIVTNGDQTDTIYEGLQKGMSFDQALQSREFEPDAPNLTPRISGILTFADGDFSYQMSILKSIDPEGSGCARYLFSYPAKAGLGHFIHTYVCDGDPIPSRSALRSTTVSMISPISFGTRWMRTTGSHSMSAISILRPEKKKTDRSIRTYDQTAGERAVFLCITGKE